MKLKKHWGAGARAEYSSAQPLCVSHLSTCFTVHAFSAYVSYYLKIFPPSQQENWREEFVLSSWAESPSEYVYCFSSLYLFLALLQTVVLRKWQHFVLASLIIKEEFNKDFPPPLIIKDAKSFFRIIQICHYLKISVLAMISKYLQQDAHELSSESCKGSLPFPLTQNLYTD